MRRVQGGGEEECFGIRSSGSHLGASGCPSPRTVGPCRAGQRRLTGWGNELGEQQVGGDDGWINFNTESWIQQKEQRENPPCSDQQEEHQTVPSVSAI